MKKGIYPLTIDEEITGHFQKETFSRSGQSNDSRLTNHNIYDRANNLRQSDDSISKYSNRESYTPQGYQNSNLYDKKRLCYPNQKYTPSIDISDSQYKTNKDDRTNDYYIHNSSNYMQGNQTETSFRHASRNYSASKYSDVVHDVDKERFDKLKNSIKEISTKVSSMSKGMSFLN
jgi:hypothetical protein